MARPAVIFALAGGLLVVSTASILTRLAQAEGVPSLAIAAWRLTLASLILVPLMTWKAGGELRALGADRLWLLGSGVFLALHFATWILSLQFTSVASSVALVTTNPIWIGLFSFFILRERVQAAKLAAITLALAGSGVILWNDAGQVTQSAPQPTLGNALALTGSLAMCGYLLIGRRLRGHLSLVAYIGVVYVVAAACLMGAALATGTTMAGYPIAAWGWLAALALGPQLLGHTAFNYALKHISATTIAVVVLGEPVGSSILAWWLFGEAIGPVKLAGMGLLLAGVFLAAKSEQGGAIHRKL